MNEPLKAPFPYFGGKSRIASVVWDALGDVKNYVEPFFGSGAVLLSRPHDPRTETVNDADGMVSNFWRALQRDPDSVAQHADNPVNECDLHARHLWLVGQRERIADRLCGDPEFYDPKAAGWWAWGMSCWIGSGWCAGKGPWIRGEDGAIAKRGSVGTGIERKRPHLGNAGMGVNRQLPHLGNAGMGVNRQLPHLGDAGRGVNRQRPHLGNAGQGECADRRAWLISWMNALADRLRNVRVCCGDWARVTGPSVTTKHGLTGVFLDPPYSAEAGRDNALYAVESKTVAHDVREWAIEHGADPLMRIVLCGYDDEHAMPGGWKRVAWKAHGGYGSQGNGTGRDNSHRERLWMSPHCVRAGAAAPVQEVLL